MFLNSLSTLLLLDAVFLLVLAIVIAPLCLVKRATLAVLKRMGPGRAGYLSFPMEGYTLAVDFPNRAAARDLIRALEDDTADAGGRLYFAKDALAAGARIPAMYPELDAWRQEVAKADPARAYETDLVRRLKLRNA